LELDLFVDKICCPDTDAVIMDCDELRVRVVVEQNLVGSVCANWVAAERLARLDLRILMLEI
jgi:predicted RNA-binding protein associated with RNAse of E/G family